MSGEQSLALLQLLESRRSVRRFLPDPVPPALVELLLRAAACAPSASNRQAWRLVVVRSAGRIAAMGSAVDQAIAELLAATRPDRVEQTRSYLEHFLHFRTAPLVMVPLYRPGVDLLEVAGRSGPPSPAPEPGAPAPPLPGRSWSDALSSVAAAIENLLLQAHACGLGCCWMTGPLLAADSLKALLEVTRGWEIAALLPLGYPAEQPAPPPARRTLTQLVRWID